MYFDAIAKIVSERTGCDVADIKPESTFSELGIEMCIRDSSNDEFNEEM